MKFTYHSPVPSPSTIGMWWAHTKKSPWNHNTLYTPHIHSGSRPTHMVYANEEVYACTHTKQVAKLHMFLKWTQR